MGNIENKSGRPAKHGENPFTEIFRKLVGEATQQEIANKVDVSRQNVGKWLSGVTSPDINTLCKIATAYNVSTDYLLGLQKEPTDDPDVIAVTEYTGLSKKAIENTLELTPQLKTILNKILEHKKLLYFFAIMKTAFSLKHNVLKKDSQRPTDVDEKKAAQAEKLLENTPYSVAFAFDELFGYEYQLIEQMKKIIDDVFYELESEDCNNG